MGFLVEQVENTGEKTTDGGSERVSVHVVVEEFVVVVQVLCLHDLVEGHSGAYSRIEGTSERVGACKHGEKSCDNTDGSTDTLAITSGVLALHHEDD